MFECCETLNTKEFMFGSMLGEVLVSKMYDIVSN